MIRSAYSKDNPISPCRQDRVFYLPHQIMIELLIELIIRPLGRKIRKIVAKKRRIITGQPATKEQLKR